MERLIVNALEASSSPTVHAHALSRETRVAILFQRFGPYHHARLNAAGRLMSVFGVEACAQEDTYAWDKVDGANAFTRITLTDRNSDGRQWRRELHQKIRRALDEIKPRAVVIPGWVVTEALSALEWCVQTKTPAVVMSESTVWDETRRSWKEFIKGRIVQMCAAGLAGGTAHAAYLAQLGMPGERVFLGYDIVENDYFAAKADDRRKHGAENRKKFGLPENYFLASARFIEKKNLFRLIKAYARYRELAGKSECWDMVLLGDGELRSSIMNLRSTLGLESCVHLPGFKQYDELPVYFGLAGAFVHASTTEQWGLVVNEAMASGLPVLVSNRCGCAPDLVKEGVNGFAFDPYNIEQLASLMLNISKAKAQLSKFGAASREIISDWGPERFASGVKQAVETALCLPPPKPNLADRALLRLLLSR